MNERDPQTYAILGACYAVHGEKGCGFLEPVYHECLEIELGLCGIPFQHEHPFSIEYRGRPLKSKYITDFICYSDVLVELKAVEKLTDTHQAQVINCLKASGLHRGLLVNFGTRSLEFKRIVL